MEANATGERDEAVLHLLHLMDPTRHLRLDCSRPEDDIATLEREQTIAERQREMRVGVRGRLTAGLFEREPDAFDLGDEPGVTSERGGGGARRADRRDLSAQGDPVREQEGAAEGERQCERDEGDARRHRLTIDKRSSTGAPVGCERPFRTRAVTMTLVSGAIALDCTSSAGGTAR